MTKVHSHKANLFHDIHVARGYCTYIHWTKAWCNDNSGLAHDHWATRLHRDGTKTREILL